MLELILKILVCVFAVFGLYAFAHALAAVCFPNPCLKWTVFVDSAAVSEQIELYCEEAKGALFLYGKREIFVVVMKKYATDDLLRFLKRKRIPYRILTDNG
ncbi:MAG: hypothetical protein J6D16_06030 [Clostridia bacterium]|nr:hypothetical protein [Clostridia bacterium]